MTDYELVMSFMSKSESDTGKALVEGMKQLIVNAIDKAQSNGADSLSEDEKQLLASINVLPLINVVKKPMPGNIHTLIECITNRNRIGHHYNYDKIMVVSDVVFATWNSNLNLSIHDCKRTLEAIARFGPKTRSVVANNVAGNNSSRSVTEAQALEAIDYIKDIVSYGV